MRIFGRMPLSFLFPALRGIFPFTFFTSDVKDNFLCLEFLNEFKIIVNCHNLTLTDNLTGLSMRNTLTPNEDSRLSVQVDNNDYSSIENDKLRAILEKSSDVYCDVKNVKYAFDEMQRRCIVQPFKNICSSPLHMFLKKEFGDFRDCSDYQSVSDSYTMPKLSMVELNIRQIFSKH